MGMLARDFCPPTQLGGERRKKTVSWTIPFGWRPPSFKPEVALAAAWPRQARPAAPRDGQLNDVCTRRDTRVLLHASVDPPGVQSLVMMNSGAPSNS
jgi:hypothetical protein